jgi:hypothetical protein
MMNALSINPTVAASIDRFIQAAGISPASMRWLLHLTPTEGGMAHTTTTLLQYSGTTDPGDVQWQFLSVTDACGWPDMQRPFQELYVDIEQHQYWYCKGGSLNPSAIHSGLRTMAGPLYHASPHRVHPSRSRTADADTE